MSARQFEKASEEPAPQRKWPLVHLEYEVAVYTSVEPQASSAAEMVGWWSVTILVKMALALASVSAPVTAGERRAALSEPAVGDADEPVISISADMPAWMWQK